MTPPPTVITMIAATMVVTKPVDRRRPLSTCVSHDKRPAEAGARCADKLGANAVVESARLPTIAMPRCLRTMGERSTLEQKTIGEIFRVLRNNTFAVDYLLQRAVIKTQSIPDNIRLG